MMIILGSLQPLTPVHFFCNSSHAKIKHLLRGLRSENQNKRSYEQPNQRLLRPFGLVRRRAFVLHLEKDKKGSAADQDPHPVEPGAVGCAHAAAVCGRAKTGNNRVPLVPGRDCFLPGRGHLSRIPAGKMVQARPAFFSAGAGLLCHRL